MKQLISKKTIRRSILFSIIILLAMNWQSVWAMTTLVKLDWVGGDTVRCSFGKCVVFDNPYEGVAELLGMSENDLEERYHYGNEELTDLAYEAGVDIQRVIDLLVANEIAWVDQLVADRYYTELEGQITKGEAVGQVTLHVKSPYQDPFVFSAKIIGIYYPDLADAVELGQTPADVAQLNGIDPDMVYQLLLQTELDHIEAKLKYGVIDETMAEFERINAAQFAEQVIYEEGFYDEFWSLGVLPVRNARQIPDKTDTSDLEEILNTSLGVQPRNLNREVVISSSAHAIGISGDLLTQELNKGKKIAEVANEHNVDPQRVVDALSLVQAGILNNLTALGALNEEDIDSLLEDQNFVIREIVHKVDLSQ